MLHPTGAPQHRRLETLSPPGAASGGLRRTCRERDPGPGTGLTDAGRTSASGLRWCWLVTDRRTTRVSDFNGGEGPDVGVYGNSTLRSIFLSV